MLSKRPTSSAQVASCQLPSVTIRQIPGQDQFSGTHRSSGN